MIMSLKFLSNTNAQERHTLQHFDWDNFIWYYLQTALTLLQQNQQTIYNQHDHDRLSIF